jgi:predicted nucleic acid-binding protein
MYTIDASVFVNAGDPQENGYDISRALFARLRVLNVSLVLPSLVLAEVAAGIARPRGDEDLARRLVQNIRRLPLVQLLPLTEELAGEAAELAIVHRLRGADAVYAVVALRTGTTLISLDREHQTRLRSILKVITPAEALAILASLPFPPSSD